MSCRVSLLALLPYACRGLRDVHLESDTLLPGSIASVDDHLGFETPASTAVVASLLSLNPTSGFQAAGANGLLAKASTGASSRGDTFDMNARSRYLNGMSGGVESDRLLCGKPCMASAFYQQRHAKLGSRRSLLSVLLAGMFTIAMPFSPAVAATATTDTLERVVDGDTVILKSLGRVRLIGMNTPETVAPAQKQGAPPGCYGPEASEYTKKLLPPGTAVKLEFDQEPTDGFGRNLAYVYLQDGTFVNGKLVSEGYARAKAYGKNTRYKDKLESLQSEAIANGKGLWKACSDAKASSAKGFDKRRAGPPEAKAVAASKPASASAKSKGSADLPNPGDTKNCKDFKTYDEAKSWFDLYFPLYGDVAKLDGDGDGTPCESLPGAPPKSAKAAVKAGR